jgi:hypothetical protein
MNFGKEIRDQICPANSVGSAAADLPSWRKVPADDPAKVAALRAAETIADRSARPISSIASPRRRPAIQGPQARAQEAAAVVTRCGDYMVDDE